MKSHWIVLFLYCLFVKKNNNMWNFVGFPTRWKNSLDFLNVIFSKPWFGCLEMRFPQYDFSKYFISQEFFNHDQYKISYMSPLSYESCATLHGEFNASYGRAAWVLGGTWKWREDERKKEKKWRNEEMKRHWERKKR